MTRRECGSSATQTTLPCLGLGRRIGLFWKLWNGHGTLFEEDSDWNWNDIWEYGLYDEERDDYIIPDGWWESRCFTPDGYYNCPVDCEVTHWRLLPEPPTAE